MEELDAALTAHGGGATAEADDVYAVGPPRVVLLHLERFGRKLREVGLQLHSREENIDMRQERHRG